MRRLPVYLLLDTSGSMIGEPIESVKNGLQTLVAALRTDPYAVETAHLSVITFNSDVSQSAPLTPLTDFQQPNLNVGGLTELGKALSFLGGCIEREVTKSTADRKGDWKPLVFIMTDGVPTDDWKKGLADFKKHKVGQIVACAAGHDADTSILKQITEAVVQLATADENTIKAFFEWVSASISVSSQLVDAGAETALGDLPPPPPEINLVL